MRIIVVAVLLMGCLSMEASDEKLSFGLRQLMAQRQAGTRTAGDPDAKLGVFVRFKTGTAEQLLADYGCEKVTQIGDIYIVNATLSQLSAMAESDGVVRMEAQFGGRRLNDMTPRWVKSKTVQEGTGLPQAFDGEGVLLGIVDGGFDLTHPSFYSMDGDRYRIKGFVDDYYAEDDTIGILTPLGREYGTEAEILAKKCSGDTLNYHGTHCMSIAAGSGYGTPYRGMALGADIFAVSSKIGSESYYSSASEVARMKRVFDYADETGQPCVITYSIGFNDLPDDAQLFGEALDRLTGEGRIVVAAAGNSNQQCTYLEKPADKATAGTVMALNTDESLGIAYLSSDQAFRLKCLIQTIENRNVTISDSVIFDTQQLPTDSILLGTHHIILEKQGSFYTLTDRKDFVEGDFESLLLLIEGAGSEVRMYVDDKCYFYDDFLMDSDGRFRDAEHSHNVSLPGSLPGIVTVGALNGREAYTNMAGRVVKGFGDDTPVGTIAVFSSVGPTKDGRIKPDVVAPGVNVIAAGSSFYSEDYGAVQIAATSFREREYPWVAVSGTSMATPCVAGIVALWLQADPTLTPERVKEVLEATSQPPVDTLEYPNATYGYGLIDAYAGMLYVLGIPDAIQDVSTHQPSALRIRPSAVGQVWLRFASAPTQPFKVRVYTVSGMLLTEQTVVPTNAKDYSIVMADTPGLRVVQVDSEERGVTGSELIQLK